MNWYLNAFRNYAVFSGRARRKEYWMFALFNIIAAFIAAILDNVLGLSYSTLDVSLGYGLIYTIYSVFIIIPSLALLVRRLHDIDKSGGWFFITFVPCIGPFWLLILLCLEGTNGENRYGSDPKM